MWLPPRNHQQHLPLRRGPQHSSRNAASSSSHTTTTSSWYHCSRCRLEAAVVHSRKPVAPPAPPLGLTRSTSTLLLLAFAASAAPAPAPAGTSAPDPAAGGSHRS